jgi:hypothetical protein
MSEISYLHKDEYCTFIFSHLWMLEGRKQRYGSKRGNTKRDRRGREKEENGDVIIAHYLHVWKCHD